MCSITSPNQYLFPYREKIAGGQDCALFTNVFRYLDLQETTTGILVSKSWRTTITQTSILQKVLFKQFHIFGSVDTFDQVDYFLFGEDHTLPICKRLLAGAISCLSYGVPLILLTEVPYTWRINVERQLKFMGLPISLASRIEIYGWDDAEYLKELGNLPEFQIELENRCISLKHDIKILEETQTTTTDPEEALTLENRILLLRRDLEKSEKQLKKGPFSINQLRKAFPQRTKNMIRVLNSLSKQIQIKGFRGRVIVQCGLAHVITLPIHHNKKEYCLEEFYNYLSNFRFWVLHSNKIDVSSIKYKEL